MIKTLPCWRHTIGELDDAAERHTIQHFEIFGNRGIDREGWSGCTMHAVPWVRCG